VEKKLLGTGGGIRNVKDFWDERPFVVINGDILSCIDLQEVLRYHKDSGASVTMVLVDEPKFNNVAVGADGRIVAFRREAGSKNLAFTGIQVIDPQILAHIPDGAVSIIDCYRSLISTGERIIGLVVDKRCWRELGSLAAYVQVHREFANGTADQELTGRHCRTAAVDSTAKLGAGVELRGMVWIGKGCRIEDRVTIVDSILWDGVQVKVGCTVRRSIVADGVAVNQSVVGAVLAQGISSDGAEQGKTREALQEKLPGQ